MEQGTSEDSERYKIDLLANNSKRNSIIENLRYWLKNIHDVDDVLDAFHDGVDGGDEHELRNNYLDRERLLLRH